MISDEPSELCVARVCRLGVAVCVALSVFLLSGSPALAFSSQSRLVGVAVDNSPGSAQDPFAGDVYVAAESGTVAVFGSGGSPLGQFSVPGAGQIAVDSSGGGSTGDVYVADPSGGVVYKVAASGHGEYAVVKELVGLSEPVAVAVDGAGDVYVVQLAAGNVFEFSAAGEALDEGQPILEGLSEPRGIAVDAHGDIYIADKTQGVVEFTPAGGGFSSPKTIDAGGASAVAVDSSTGAVYVDRVPGGVHPIDAGAGASIEEFNAAGTLIGASTDLQGPSEAVAESEASKRVYATHWNAFGEGALLSFASLDLPEAELGGPGCPLAGPAETMLCATVTWRSGGQINYHFEYGTDPTYGSQAPELSGTIDISPSDPTVTVSATPSGLLSNITYHYRLVVTSGHMTARTVDGTFVAPLTKPVVLGEAATEPATGEAKSESPSGASAAKSESPGTSTPPVRPPDGGSRTVVAARQTLARALRACEKQPRKRRASCVRQARRRYRVATARHVRASRRQDRNRS